MIAENVNWNILVEI